MILMHGNKPVAEIEMKNNIPIGYKKIYCIEDLPLGTTSDYKENERILLNKWYKSRSIPNIRTGLDLINIDKEKSFIESLGISLTDTYWLKDDNKTTSWDEINFHDNGFYPVFLNYYIKHILEQKKSPDFTTDGVMEKFWYSSNGVPFLAKLDRQYNNVLIANEVVYSEIALYHGIKCVPYFPGKLEDLYLCSCQCFVKDSKTDFITAIQVKHQNFSLSGSRLLYYFVNNLGFEKEISNMLLLDCFFHNVDRHEKNFGYLKSDNNLQFAPLYDSGYCLGANRIFCDDNDIKNVNNNDLKLFSSSRSDILLNVINHNVVNSFDFDSSFVNETLRKTYEYYCIPEKQYEIAKAEINYSYKIFSEIKHQIMIESNEYEL